MGTEQRDVSRKKKQRRGGVRGESEVSFLFPSPLFLLIFLPLSYLVPHFTIGTPETGYPFAEWVNSVQSPPITRSYATRSLIISNYSSSLNGL